MPADYKGLEANIAETSVIGSMLIDDRTVPEVMQVLRPDDFSDSDFRHVFDVIRSLYLQRKMIDPVTVLGALGSEYQQKLLMAMDLTPTAANCMAYVQIMRDNHQLREIQSVCLQAAGKDVDLATAREILSKAAGLLVQCPADRDRSYSELLADFYTRQIDKTPPDYLDWGIKELNTGLQVGSGRFVILGADSSVGKTALALQFALNFAKSGKRVGFFSYETTLNDATDRLAANDADISLGRSKYKHLTTDELDQVLAAGERSEKLNLRILESARYTVSDIRAKCIAHSFEVILVDYVQLIPTRRKDRYEAVTEISIELHAIAQELGITVIGLSQVTVPETDKKGRRRSISKDDLRESRQLKQDADIILLLDLADPTDRYGNRVLQVAKNRDGPLGRFVLKFIPSRMRFDYVPPVEGTADAASRERAAKIDANRAAKAEQERQDAEWAASQVKLTELTGEDDDLPF